MIPLVTAAEMRAADAHVIDELLVPARVLMETAGRACADVARRHAPHKRVAVVCGVGNNGGDGLVVARVLGQWGFQVETLVVGQRDALKTDALANLVSLEKAGGTARFLSSEEESRDAVHALREHDVLVDALFGTGLARDVTGAAAAAIEAMNLRGNILAVDLPSGINADTGATLGISVRARWTVALGAMKRAHALLPGADRCGEVTVADIGIPVPATQCQALEISDGRMWHQKRTQGAHKGSAGHVLVVGGSPGMTGAAVLSSRGALRGGAGRVSCVKLDVSDLPPEVTTTVLEPDALHAFVRDTRIAALVVGPGLSTEEDSRRWLDAALALERPMVLDAGALTLLGHDVARLKDRAFPTVLTPHPAELGRLLGMAAVDIQLDRVGHALQAAEKSGAVVVHKGARTVVATPQGEVSVILGGHPVLATGGTGDVLAGIIGALLGKGLSAHDAARLGTLLHARAGELCAVNAGPEGVLASEVADAVPGVFAELERAS